MTKATLSVLVIAKLANLPSCGFAYDLDKGLELRGLPEALEGAEELLQVSAQLVRSSWEGATGPYEIQVSAWAIGPISNLDALAAAMDQALAKGYIRHITTLHEGAQIMDVALFSNGWEVTSGRQKITILGDMPDTFAEARLLQDLVARADDLGAMSFAARADWLREMADHGMTSVGLRSGGKLVFGLGVEASSAWMQMGGLRLMLEGAVSGGLALSMMTTLSRILATGRVDLSLLRIEGLTGATLTDGAGRVLMQVSDLAEADRFWIGAREFDDWQIGRRAGEVLSGRMGEVATILTGFGGDDLLWGQGGNDALYGGEGDDTVIGGTGDDLIQGGNGRDLAVFGAATGVRVDLRRAGPQETGLGRDLLIGIEDLTGGIGNDWLHGHGGENRLEGLGGRDRLDGGAGNDQLFGGMGADVLIGGTGDDSLEGGMGDDLMTGGAGADHFIFRASGQEVALGLDQVLDFEPGTDRIVLASGAQTALWASLTAAEVVARYGALVEDPAGAYVELRFGPNQVLSFHGLSTLAELEAALIL